ncbi:YihY/virulence factor BrkB family protein [Phenylobacterium sp.]|uniref:YihY/virulence factor BrkB family protein n=1 Tax=Phenylobacterium sp. TaxID=1871053 RepID=UPI002810EBD4|nr:YihY/virulence factor BrkB family protein [Phenylobacterium sp.]
MKNGKTRGRSARTPQEIGRRGWTDILWRAWRGLGRDALPTVARGIAFSAVMALLPGLAAFVSLYGLFADATKAREHLSLLAGVVPPEALSLMGDEMVRIATQADGRLGLTFFGGLAVAFWTANTGMKTLIRGLNIAYEEKEQRSFLRLNLVAAALTLSAFAFALVTAGALLALPVILTVLGAPEWRPFSQLRWPMLLAMAVLALEVLYRVAPSRRPAKWRWLSVGSLLAAVLWMSGAALLALYVRIFGSYSAAYGSLGAIFAVLLWFWLTALVILLGAKLNAEAEHQTLVDTTTGAARPMGERGAVMADTVGSRSPRRRRG